MELSLELMKQGSYQVEMSDEGLMTDDIEECLAGGHPSPQEERPAAGEMVAWCTAMTKSDRVGCIYDRELQALQRQFAVMGS